MGALGEITNDSPSCLNPSDAAAAELFGSKKVAEKPASGAQTSRRFIEKPGDDLSWEIADGAAESSKSRESASGAWVLRNTSS